MPSQQSERRWTDEDLRVAIQNEIVKRDEIVARKNAEIADLRAALAREAEIDDVLAAKTGESR